MRDVWGIRAHADTRTVDTNVKRLRQKLGPAAPVIETIRNVGYRFIERPAASIPHFTTQLELLEAAPPLDLRRRSGEASWSYAGSANAEAVENRPAPAKRRPAKLLETQRHVAFDDGLGREDARRLTLLTLLFAWWCVAVHDVEVRTAIEERRQGLVLDEAVDPAARSGGNDGPAGGVARRREAAPRGSGRWRCGRAPLSSSFAIAPRGSQARLVKRRRDGDDGHVAEWSGRRSRWSARSAERPRIARSHAPPSM